MGRHEKPNLSDLEQRLDKIRPHLKQRTWPPMTYMLIPSVLEAADELFAELKHIADADNERVSQMLTELVHLRQDFRRER